MTLGALLQILLVIPFVLLIWIFTIYCFIMLINFIKGEE